MRLRGVVAEANTETQTLTDVLHIFRDAVRAGNCRSPFRMMLRKILAVSRTASSRAMYPSCWSN